MTLGHLQDFVEASVTYAVPGEEKLSTTTTGPGGRLREMTGQYQPASVRIYNGRGALDAFSLDKTGFVLRPFSTAVTDFWEPEQIKGTFYPEMEVLIKENTGADEVVIFDHTLRSGESKHQEEHFAREPVSLAHNDYTVWSGPQRVRDLLPEAEAAKRLKGRVSIIQVWHPISGPVLSWPLAFCLPESLRSDDMVASERRHPNRVGEIYLLTHHPDHKWVYFPHMTTEEALVFRCYDSMTDGRIRFTPHTSFDDPTTPAGAPSRQSIEIRALAFFSS